MNATGTTRQPAPPAPWTVSRIFRTAVAVTFGVIAAVLVAFAILALLFA